MALLPPVAPVLTDIRCPEGEHRRPSGLSGMRAGWWQPYARRLLYEGVPAT